MTVTELEALADLLILWRATRPPDEYHLLGAENRVFDAVMAELDRARG